MKRIFSLVFVAIVATVTVFGQTAGGGKAPSARFPGASESDFVKLRTAKLSTPLPLPTWVPVGFKIEKITMKLGTKIPIQDRVLVIVYSRKLSSGKMQRFAFEAGFDGLGGLPYDLTKVVSSAVGKIDLMYQPLDIDDSGKKLLDFAMTEWFKVGRTDFHYDGMYGHEEGDTSMAMISMSDTEKILRSLQRF